MKQPLVTIISPTYNPGAKLAVSVDSVLAQRPDLFEYWVIDGGSTDGSVDVLKGYGDKVNWISEPDRGIYDAMNKGLERAKGEYIYFLGAGDVMRPGILEKIADRLPPDRPAYVYGDVYWVSTESKHGGRVYDGPFDNYKISLRSPCHQAVFYQHGIFDLHGNYELQYVCAADWALNLKCFGDARVSKTYINEIIADYEGGGWSETIPDPTWHADQVRLIARNLGAYYAVVWWIRVELPRKIDNEKARWRYIFSRSPGYLAGKVWEHLSKRLRRQQPR
jgi:glycosyltransferase involved in cell wall biosynthesis